jgi:hypothetical protein
MKRQFIFIAFSVWAFVRPALGGDRAVADFMCVK